MALMHAIRKEADRTSLSLERKFFAGQNFCQKNSIAPWILLDSSFVTSHDLCGNKISNAGNDILICFCRNLVVVVVVVVLDS